MRIKKQTKTRKNKEVYLFSYINKYLLYMLYNLLLLRNYRLTGDTFHIDNLILIWYSKPWNTV